MSIIEETRWLIKSKIEFNSLPSVASTLMTNIGSVLDLRARYQPVCSPLDCEVKRTLTPSMVDAS